ncbi:MAG: DUF928 domain-containing protein [Symploca sp. SIO2E9]|nr:DUF928 domain-containing protein [Symploca sp. SIO2E9]
MFAPKFISAPLKAIPTLTISLMLMLSSAHPTQGSNFVQADVDLNERPAALEPPSGLNHEQGNLITETETFFRPPSNPKPRSGPRTTTGTRQGGCLGNTETAFTIFGPDAVIGRTVSTHPEFVWHLPASETTFPVIFRLLAPNESGIPEPIHVTELSYTSGFIKYQLPANVQALAPGIEYRWQVIIECNPNYPSQALVQERSLEVVSSPASLSQALATATTDSQRALAYGNQGLWYDAIAQVAQATTADGKQTRSGLLRDLAALVAPDQEQLSQNIIEIAEATAN